jgi:hypothetical protein
LPPGHGSTVACGASQPVTERTPAPAMISEIAVRS